MKIRLSSCLGFAFQALLAKLLWVGYDSCESVQKKRFQAKKTREGNELAKHEEEGLGRARFRLIVKIMFALSSGADTRSFRRFFLCFFFWIGWRWEEGKGSRNEMKPRPRQCFGPKLAAGSCGVGERLPSSAFMPKMQASHHSIPASKATLDLIIIGHCY